MSTGIWNVIKREVRHLSSRPLYVVGMLVVPIVMSIFFVVMLSPGLPHKVPAAVVDLDHSQMSRQLTRSLDAMELIDIQQLENSYNDAIQAVQRGEIYGFFVIPEGFERDAIGGRATALTFYSNLTFYVPGTMIFKGFKTLAVTTSGKLVKTDLVSKGAPQSMADTLLQPMTIQTHPLNNPWTNYSYYLSTSFIPGLLELMIFLITVYSIAHELKTGSSRQWLSAAGGNIYTAILGKLAPQTLIFTIVGFGANAMMFNYLHFPMHGPMWTMLLAMLLFVIASQSFALLVCELLPNLRLALSVCSLVGILAFSIAAFSFPLQAMYGSVAIFSYIMPVRWYFLIYIDQALNGIPFYFSRLYYVALLVFPLVAMLGTGRLKRAAANPVYVP